jgi:integrase/recombinase XerC
MSIHDLSSPFNEIYNKFLDYLQYEKGYTYHTIRAYKTDIKQFLQFLQKESLTLEEMEKSYFRSYFSWMNSKFKISKRSQARKINALRSLFRFLIREKIVKTNSAKNFSTPRYQSSLPKPYYPNEMGEILEFCKTDKLYKKSKSHQKNPKKTNDYNYLTIRNQVIIELFYSTGMRVSELCRIKFLDIEPVYQRYAAKKAKRKFQNRHNSQFRSPKSNYRNGDLSEKIKIRGKGNKERYVFIGRKCLELMSDYIKKREGFLIGKNRINEYLFLNKSAYPLTTRGVRYILTTMDKHLSVPRGMHPHRFRHTFASDLLNNGADIRAVQEMLGHASLSTTQKYIKISKDRLREVYRKTHPHA